MFHLYTEVSDIGIFICMRNICLFISIISVCNFIALLKPLLHIFV